MMVDPLIESGRAQAHGGCDPEDWPEFRALAHRMVDDMVDHLIDLEHEPVWHPIPENIRDQIQTEPLPRIGMGDAAAYSDFLDQVFPYRNGNLHPRFYGWVQGNGTPLANVADLLASVMNAHLAGHDQSPVLVEKKVIAWLAELMGFPINSSGILETGTTMANILALAVARHKLSGRDVRSKGLQETDGPVTVYCSTESHGCIQKGVELLGIGTDWLRMIEVDDQYRIDPKMLADQILEDRNRGFRPICVIGNAGTVNTGAFDDLNALADICESLGIWFHVDGAFGAMARLSPQFDHLLSGLERADSLAVDLHKWMCLPFEIACLLVKDSAAHTDTFSLARSYIAPLDRGVIAGGLPFSDRGVDLTRGFKALKAWMCIKSYGIDRICKVIEQNVAQTQYLVSLIHAHPDLELLAPAPLNIACFRYNPKNLSDGQLANLNLEVLLRLQESGLAVTSSTVIGGRFAIRFCNVNHRSRFEDIDRLVSKILELGKVIEESG